VVGSEELDADFGGEASRAVRKGLQVRFYKRAVEDKRASWGYTTTEEVNGRMVEKREPGAGRLITRDVDYIDIACPGDRTVRSDRPVTESDKKRFPDLWRRYQAQQADAQKDGVTSGGTPLAVLPGVSVGAVEELAYLGIRTIEALAETPDGNLNNAGSYLKLRDKARAFVQAASSTAPVASLQAQMDEMKRQHAATQAQLEQALAALSKQADVKPEKQPKAK
jgi:predicted RecB family nuclease